LTSATKAKVGGLYVNAREGVILCTTLEELGLGLALQTDNTTAHGIINGTYKQQLSSILHVIDIIFD
jgi:hypothetical protein